MKFLAKRPKRFGWKSVKTPATPATPAARRAGWKVPMTHGLELEPLRELRVRDGGYLVAPCLVLWAAVWGTREAYEYAMANMAAARGCDFRRV